MNVPLEISFRNISGTNSIEDLIRSKAEKLQRYCDHISSCRVAVEKTQKHQRTGSRYRVRLDITVPPGHEIVVKREPSRGRIHYPLTSVIRDAFDAAGRRIKELDERQQRQIKRHPRQEMNAVIHKLHEEGYGFLRTLDDREVYFHRNSVVAKDFQDLKIGDGVHFREEIGVNGPQASSVHVVNRTNY